MHVWGEAMGAGSFDLLSGTLQFLSCGGIWITHPCLASLSTLVWTCMLKGTWMHPCRQLHAGTTCAFGEIYTHILSLSLHMHKSEMICIWRVAYGTAPGEKLVLLCYDAFLPLALSAGAHLHIHASHLYTQLLFKLCSATQPWTSAREFIDCVSHRYL